MRSDYYGVKFYSVTDMSCGVSLEAAEKIIKSYNHEECIEISKVIELYNIKLFFDNNLRLLRWEESEYDSYKNIVDGFTRTIATFFSGVNDDNFIKHYDDANAKYISDFWLLVDHYKVYNRITTSIISDLLNKSDFHLRHLLECKNVVYHYGQTIADFMLASKVSAELLISQFLSAKRDLESNLYFPKELSGEQMEEILLSYIGSNTHNPNYLKLIAESQSSQQLPLQDKTKLLAKNKYDDYMKTTFEPGSGLAYSVSVAFLDNQSDETCDNSKTPREIDISYSRKWIKDNLDNPTLLNNFIYLFGYVDEHYRSLFPSQPAHFGTFERTLSIKGKKEYFVGIHYHINHMIFNSQMLGYCKELQKLEIRIEELFQWFFEDYLRNEFGADGFVYTAPSDRTTYLEKCKLLASEIDSVLKQYMLFVKEGCIDRDLFQMSSGYVKFENVPSFSGMKYIYPKDNICTNCMYLLFSDQSGLMYIQRARESFDNFFSLVQGGTFNIVDFADYQKDKIEWLAQHECINIGENGVLSLNREKTLILRDLYYKQVVCLHYLYGFQPVIDKFVAAGEIQHKASLFSRPEQAYMSYVLNKADFSNGLDLRNKYVHGTHSLLQEQHEKDYIELLKIMVLTIIKINEEFLLREKMDNKCSTPR